MDGTEDIPLHVAKFNTDFTILANFFLLIWGIHFLDQKILKQKLSASFCVIPREKFSLSRILFFNFLHADNEHLFGNTLPLLILGWFTMLPETRDFWIATAVTGIIGGLGIWRFATPQKPTVGTSGLAMGYFGFIISRGFFVQDTGQVLFAFAIFIFFGYLSQFIWLRRPRISWHGHFFGFLGGILSAWLVSLLPLLPFTGLNTP